MTPSAEQAPAAEARILLPEQLLTDGEVIILAVKPSGWFVLLASWPVLAIAAMAGVAMGLLRTAGPYQAALLVCVGVVCLRIVVACFQWMGLVYVLTNKRVMRICGLVRTDSVSCRLTEINQVELSRSPLEGPLGIGSLYFQSTERSVEQAAWINVAGPDELLKTINDAIQRAR